MQDRTDPAINANDAAVQKRRGILNQVTHQLGNVLGGSNTSCRVECVQILQLPGMVFTDCGNFMGQSIRDDRLQ